jgi:hypothetical protein
MIKILGIRITDRIKEAGMTQGVLSRHSGVITTRLGFHELTTEVCSREAYIILHLSGDKISGEKLLADLQEIRGIEIRDMIFEPGKPFINFHSEEGALRILGILVEEKNPETVRAVQKVFTSFGCVIRTRLGLNEEFFGNPAGLIILELMGDEIQMDLLEDDLQKIPRIQFRKMTF